MTDAEYLALAARLFPVSQELIDAVKAASDAVDEACNQPFDEDEACAP